MQLAWTTDLRGSLQFANGTFGPDGLWQALAVFVGDSPEDDNPDGVPVALWPSGLDTSIIPTIDAGGNYSVEDSDSAVERDAPEPGFYSANISASGDPCFDTITLQRKIEDFSERTNGSLLAADGHYMKLADGGQLNQSVGVLGLGSMKGFPHRKMRMRVTKALLFWNS